MSGTAGSIRILHVEDDPDFADLAAEFLEREDDRFVVETSHRASDGLDRISDGDFDCIVSDYDMPGRSGIDFLGAIREEHGELPFILFTGEGSEEVASEALSRGATDYLQKTSGTEQYELLANRVRNAVDQYYARQRAANFERIRALVNEVNQALIRASSREEIETGVCDTISESDPYRFAWIGEVDSETDRITARTSSGAEAGYLDEITVTIDEGPSGYGPGGTAIRERRIAVSQNIDEDPEFEPWREEAVERGYRAVAAAPLEYEDHLYGVLAVYANRSFAFDGDERELLAELADDIAHALAAIDTQNDLRSEKERFRELAESATDAIITIDTESTVRFANPAVEDHFGYAPDEVVGESLTILMPERYHGRHLGAIERFLETGERTLDWSSVEIPGRRKDGREIDLSVAFSAYSREGERYFQGIIRDVTERRVHERKLTALNDVAVRLNRSGSEEDIYARTIEATQDILEFDLSVIDVEENGYLSKVALSEDTPPEDTATMSIEEGLAGKTYREGEAFLVDDLEEEASAKPQGPYRSAISVPIGDHGVFQAVAEERDAFDHSDLELAELLISHAESALNRLDHERRLERHNEHMENFARIVSHDLRNPLNVAQGHLTLAREATDDDRLGDQLETVSRAHDRMGALIEDLLTLAQGRNTDVEVETVRLDEVVENCWRNVATRDATLVNETERSIRSDRNQLQQLFENLIRNSVEHGGEDATVRVGDSDEGFYVADDGPGIPESDRERVFEMGHTTAADGTGFGLSIVERVVEAHGWTIGVRSSADGGARFEITGIETASR